MLVTKLNSFEVRAKAPLAAILVFVRKLSDLREGKLEVAVTVNRMKGEAWFGTKNLQILTATLSSLARLVISPDETLPRDTVRVDGAMVAESGLETWTSSMSIWVPDVRSTCTVMNWPRTGSPNWATYVAVRSVK